MATDVNHFTHVGAVGKIEAHQEEITTTSIATHGGCPPTFCHNGGTCLKGSSGFSCNCKQGFHGLLCDGKLNNKKKNLSVI